jgi:hypothetical protein
VIAPILRSLGLFQLAADGGKFVFKEDPIPGHVNKLYFVLAPILSMIPALTTMTVVPFGAYLNQAGAWVPIVLANLDVGSWRSLRSPRSASTRSSSPAGPPIRSIRSSVVCAPRRS